MAFGTGTRDPAGIDERISSRRNDGFTGTRESRHFSSEAISSERSCRVLPHTQSFFADECIVIWRNLVDVGGLTAGREIALSAFRGSSSSGGGPWRSLWSEWSACKPY